MPVQIAGKDLHALGVRRPAELGEPLDIGDITVAGAHARGDARGHAEGKARSIQHRQRIDLPRFGAIGVDEDDLARDQFLFERLEAARAIFFRRDRAAHILARHHRAPGFTREMIGLAQQIGQRAGANADLLGIARHAGCFIDDARRAAALQLFQAIAMRDARQQLHQLQAIGIVAFGARGEIGLHLEELREIGIEIAQAPEEPRLAEQHDLQIERNGLRLDASRSANDPESPRDSRS